VKFTIKKQQYQRMPTEDGRGSKLVEDGVLVCDEFRVDIDLEKLLQRVGYKALHQKSRKTQLQSGAVKVFALKVYKVRGS